MSGEPLAKNLKETVDEDYFDDFIFDPDSSSSDEEHLPVPQTAATSNSDGFQRLEAKIDMHMFYFQ